MRAKMAKKTFSFLLVLVMAFMAFPLQVLAETPSQAMQGRFIGYATRTDIRLFVNGQSMEGFNIDGHVFVIAEELRNYGFDVSWNPTTRIVQIGHTPYMMMGETQVVRPYIAHATGAPVFRYYHSDIVALVNGIRVPSYNIQNLTLVRAEDIVRPTGRSFWNAQNRTLRVYTYSADAIPLVWAAPFYDAGRHSWGQYTDNYPPALFAFPGFVRTIDGQYISGSEDGAWGEGGVTMGDRWYAHGVIIMSNDTGGPGVDSNQNSGTTLHRLDRNFTTFSGLVGREDGTGMLPATVQFWGDGVLLWEQQLFGTRLPVPFEISVEGVELLRIDVHYDRGSNPHTA
jgi:hypothetical protein